MDGRQAGKPQYEYVTDAMSEANRKTHNRGEVQAMSSHAIAACVQSAQPMQRFSTMGSKP